MVMSASGFSRCSWMKFGIGPELFEGAGADDVALRGLLGGLLVLVDLLAEQVVVLRAGELVAAARGRISTSGRVHRLSEVRSA